MKKILRSFPIFLMMLFSTCFAKEYDYTCKPVKTHFSIICPEKFNGQPLTAVYYLPSQKGLPEEDVACHYDTETDNMIVFDSCAPSQTNLQNDWTKENGFDNYDCTTSLLQKCTFKYKAPEDK
ncbi:MAG: hypothetical protein AAGA27_00195 [Pseudomonadota bacterium]